MRSATFIEVYAHFEKPRFVIKGGFFVARRHGTLEVRGEGDRGLKEI